MSEKIEIKGTSFAELKQGFDICNDANFTDKYAQYTSTNKKKKNKDLERVPFNRY